MRWLVGLTAVYGIVWIGLEGNLGQVILMGVAVSLVTAGNLMQRFLGGRSFQLFGLLAAIGIGGLLTGLGSGMLAFFFMALKTGLHGHGPEFRAAEIEWVLRMIPLWGVVGLVAGVGVGVMVWGFKKEAGGSRDTTD